MTRATLLLLAACAADPAVEPPVGDSDVVPAVDTDPPVAPPDEPRDTGAPPSGWTGPDTTGEAWAQILSESGRCLTLSWGRQVVDVVAVGIDTGTVHVLARSLPVRDGKLGGPRTALTWDGRWLWVPGDGVLRLDPFTGEAGQVAYGTAAWAFGAAGDDLAIVDFQGRVDLYDDLSALAATTPSSEWPFGVAEVSTAIAWGDGEVWVGSKTPGELFHQPLGGDVGRVPLAIGEETLAGLAVDGGRVFVLRTIDPSPSVRKQVLHVHDAATGAEIAAHDLPPVGLTDPLRQGLACVVGP